MGLAQAQDSVHCPLHRAGAAVQNLIRLTYGLLHRQRNRHQAEICANVDSDREVRLSCFMMLLLEQDVPSFNSAAQASA